MNKVFIKSRRFIARNLSRLVKTIYSVKFCFITFSQNPPIIILTPGKVGSSSIYKTLNMNIATHIFHIHYISEKGINKSSLEHLNSDRKSLPLHLIISKLLRKKLNKYQGKIYVITVVREPISRAISAYFQNSDFYKNSVESNNLEIDIKKSLEILHKNFQNNIIKELEEWFNSEIENSFGIDIFQKSFDAVNDYQIFAQEKVNLLLLKMETMNKVFPKAINEFLNFDHEIELQNANIAENKHYAESYSQARKVFKIEKEQIAEIINSKYFQHFYASQEENICKRWSKI